MCGFYFQLTSEAFLFFRQNGDETLERPVPQHEKSFHGAISVLGKNNTANLHTQKYIDIAILYTFISLIVYLFDELQVESIDEMIMRTGQVETNDRLISIRKTSILYVTLEKK